MKRLITIIFISSYISFYSCQSNKNQTPISELINIAEWDSITIATMKDKFQLDTLRYIGDDMPPYEIDGILIKNFDDHIKSKLKFREREITALMEEEILSNEEVIYIYESQGDRGHEGFIRYFTLMPINKKYRYTFRYIPHTDSFWVKKSADFDDYYIQPAMYYGIEYGFLTGIRITTKITKNNKSQLSYEIIYLAVD